MSEYDYGNDSMLEMYLFESTTLLEQLDEILLESEKEENLSPEYVNEIFRIMHTIKGSSAMMDFNSITHVSHKLEDLFYIVRENGIDDDFFKELFDLVLRVSDFLRQEVEKIKNSQVLSDGNHGLIDEITDLLSRMEGATSAPLTVETSSPSPVASCVTEIDLGENLYKLHVTFTADCQMENIRAFMLVSKLDTIGKVLNTIPEELNANKDASSIISQNGFFCSLATNYTKEQVLSEAKGTLSVDTVRFVDSFAEEPTISLSGGSETTPQNDRVNGKTSPEAGSADSQNDSSKPKHIKQNLINVDLNKLDNLMDLVGEIVITESMVSGSSDLIGLELNNFNRASRQLRKLTDELQDIVMSIRMMPIASTFQKMNRIVRDMGKKLDKEVDLLLMGEATEVDKTIIDGIADPLMHLVRNAMDHAIEEKSVRIDANKNPVGKIILSAQNVGGDIIISVSDDGKGLNTEYILEKAKEKNLLTKPETEYSEKEIFNLLTLPGFSTKEAVTEFSGRGVGMDVVKKNIEKVGGTVTIESVKGAGTNIFFKIPLTLAIIASMEVKVGSNIYAIPITNIRESFKAKSEQYFSDPDHNEMIMIRGACYPIIRLHKIFNLNDTLTSLEEGIFLLVDSGNHIACVFADELLGKHQVVVKPLPLYFSRYSAKDSGIAGCTIMGDGSISLILDVQSILNQY
jgi:two-component system chemotaxis sensor kinase CheA